VTTKRKGLGLGLAACKKIMEENGGRILLQSDIEQGTVFSIYLPRGSTDRYGNQRL
jgi:C4-dicarboxylate-specific signal transduction histidine kinase